MKPYLHAKISAKKYGGSFKDYLPIHEFIDSSGSTHADIRHRSLMHHSFGCHLVEKFFGAVLVNSDNKEYSPRDIAEEHVLQDLGFIPNVSNYLDNMQIQNWMSGTEKGSSKKNKAKHIDY